MSTEVVIIGWSIIVLTILSLFFTLFKILPIQVREYRAKKDQLTGLRLLLIAFNFLFSSGIFANFLLVGGYISGLVSGRTIGKLLPYEFLIHEIITFIAAFAGYLIYTLKIKEKSKSNR